MRPLLIISLGNPGAQYANTLHSAGHTLLNGLLSYTSASPLAKDRRYANAPTSHLLGSPPTTFVQSPSLMNDSGKPVAAAWKSFVAEHMPAATTPGPMPLLVLLHDDLDNDIGRFKIKTAAGASARGQNGLKSVLGMPGFKALKFTRVGVGIGPRPTSRESRDIAGFVLGKMNRHQRDTIEGLAGLVWEGLQRERSEMPND